MAGFDLRETIVAARTTARPTPAVAKQQGRRIAWWLWPHVLSLDAPAVAVAWQHWWGVVAGMRVPLAQDALLAGGVWMIYLADRLADTMPDAPPPPDTARHAFSATHRWALGTVLGGVMAALAVISPLTLSAPVFEAGLGMLTAATIYFWLIHRQGRTGWAAIVPKEGFVGGIFAGGTAFFAIMHGGGHGRALLGAGAAVFGVLCFLNCALITSWEGSVEDEIEPSSLLNAFPWVSRHLGRICLALGAFAAGLALWDRPGPWQPLALGALALAWLDWRRERFSADALRVLADLALLLPAAGAAALWWALP
jgi:hypothetical protein